ncbi:neurogenic locus notch homolog protein 2-like isoform X1 [Haliotis rufescens]|uniref:neurogenic locus notch homolog protein 2-like isoform X1 n=1 Tax=Haliotis rufescens TaxID=6454 RepID=UPI00201F68D9|nr:neurogenic locus notch homolog protein 2-like isoform X1 [Haliotis rufescens]
MFTFCLKGFSNKVNCTKMSDQYKGTRDVKFGSSINGGIANPIVKPFTSLQTGAMFEAKVGDDYWLSNTPLPLDDMTTPLPPSHNGANIILTDKDARLTLTITVTCDPHYYGPRCSVLCDPGPADHYTCGPDGSKRCVKGYGGLYCETTPCRASTCKNNGTCRINGTGHQCECAPGYSGISCETTPCTSNHCKNQGTCRPTGSTFNCSCPSGFNGTLCQTTPCSSNPCQNQGTCRPTGSSFSCSCPSGFNGTLCETTPCVSNPCQNQGTCRPTGSTFNCSCPSRFNGTLCQTTPCSSNPCQNQGTCRPTGSTFNCSCQSGFNGTLCQTTPCTSNPCQNQGTCHATGSNITCSCPPGFSGVHCDRRVVMSTLQMMFTKPIPDVKTQSTRTSPTTGFEKCLCKNGGSCTKEENGVGCDCTSGFTGRYCETVIGLCSDSLCKNGGTCVEKRGNRTCLCPRGFTGDTCEHVDHCIVNRCHQGTCVNSGHHFVCRCHPDYSGHRCEIHNPCHQNGPCLNGGICLVQAQKATCHCRIGFTGSTCETTVKGCPDNISNCEFAECPDLNPARCVRCRAGYTQVEGRCQTCPPHTPILHCEEEASVGCLFWWCNRCEQGFYREATACEVCPRLHAGCRDHVCSSTDDVRCVSCHPGFFLAGSTCKECPSPNPTCDEVICSDANDVTCTKCKDGYLEVDGQCIPCPSTILIPDCVDVGRDGCFKHWCRKCAPGFFISGTACDVCALTNAGCQMAECNSTEDSRCVRCFHGYELQGGTCTHSHDNGPSTISSQCVDHLNADCASLQSSLNVCSEPSTACRSCPRYCNMCHTCTQGVPIIG